MEINFWMALSAVGSIGVAIITGISLYQRWRLTHPSLQVFVEERQGNELEKALNFVLVNPGDVPISIKKITETVKELNTGREIKNILPNGPYVPPEGKEKSIFIANFPWVIFPKSSAIWYRKLITYKLPIGQLLVRVIFYYEISEGRTQKKEKEVKFEVTREWIDEMKTKYWNEKHREWRREFLKGLGFYEE